MAVVQTLHPQGSTEHELLCSELKTHYIKVSELDNTGKHKNSHEIDPRKVASKIDADTDVLYIQDGELYLFRNQNYTVYCDSNIRENISKYVLDNYKYSHLELSCRSQDLYLLDGALIDGSPNFSKSPEKWVRGNPFFDLLRPKPFYDRLLAFNLDKRGMFLKLWTYRAQRNYFHPAVNSGLPLIKKADAIHEGTFMMHDMFHYIFLDPIITGHETDEEAVVYIVCRMMSEACTLVLADMMAVAHSGIENMGYDITKRRIYPLFKSLKLNPFDIETIRKVLYANCVYVMFGNTSVYEDLGADQDALQLYTGKYENFFSGDFTWNETNIKRVLDEMNEIPGLRYYFDGLDEGYKKFNTHYLTEKIKTKEGRLSFNKLFEIFWDQLVSLIYYKPESNPELYAKTAYTKYISGQMYLVYKHNDLQQAKRLINQYDRVVSKLQKTKGVEKINQVGAEFVGQINQFIDHLHSKDLITEIESQIYKLHVPHFPAEYVNYDIDNFEPLKKVSTRILGGYFQEEKLKYKKLEPKLRKYYFQTVGGEYDR